jgi:hypothetical protein
VYWSTKKKKKKKKKCQKKKKKKRKSTSWMREKKLGEIRPILARNARDKRDATRLRLVRVGREREARRGVGGTRGRSHDLILFKIKFIFKSLETEKTKK